MPKTEPKATRKPREKPAPYTKRKPKQVKEKDAPKTSAKPAVQTKRANLTLSDWLTVLKYADEHPLISQGDIVEHFKTKIDGALHFSQSALSCAIGRRTELEERSQSNPTALSSKRARIVTRPDVERALVLWVSHMLEKKETVSGPMLREKRKRFEILLSVPDDQQLTGEGWVASFCATYKLKEYRRHGEAGSVDLEAVEVERKRLQTLTETFKPRDRWNFDETSLFPK